MSLIHNKILLIDDSREIKLLVEDALNGFEIDYAEDADAGLKKIKNKKYDLILLDLILPDSDGLAVYKKIKEFEKNKKTTPVIFLTLKNDTTNKVKAFAMGAADYVAKPFDPAELRARVLVRLQNSTDASEASANEIRRGQILIKINEHEIYCACHDKTKKYKLTPTEFRLFYLLFNSDQAVVSRDVIMNKVWSDKSDVGSRIVDKYMTALRRKICQDTFILESIHGHGYRMIIQEVA